MANNKLSVLISDLQGTFSDLVHLNYWLNVPWNQFSLASIPWLRI